MGSKTSQYPFLTTAALTDGRLRQAQLKMLTMLEAVDQICQRHNLDYWLEGGTLLGAIRHQGFIPWDDDLDIAMTRESFTAFLKLAPSELPNHLFLQTPTTDPGFFNLQAPLKIRDKNSLLIELHEQGIEPYQQGIFLDVFSYDRVPSHPFQRKLHKSVAKKLLRILKHKHSTVKMGHYHRLYQLISKAFSKETLQNWQNALIVSNNRRKSAYFGVGYDSVDGHFLKFDDIFPLRKACFETGEFFIPNHSELILEQFYGDYLQLPPENQRTPKHCRELIPHFE